MPRKNPLADWKLRPRAEVPARIVPESVLAALLARPVQLAALESGSELSRLEEVASSAADARLWPASFESHFAQVLGVRAEFAPRRCLRLKQDPSPVRACSSGLSVSTSAEATSSGQGPPGSEAAAHSPGEALDWAREPALCCGRVRDFPGEPPEPAALAD